MFDLRNVDDSPLQLRDDVTPTQLRSAIEKRHKMINAVMDLAIRHITGKEVSEEMNRQISETVDLLNNEIDAMEKILVEH
jgi:hypothetical protein